jgi:hypothetical protein
MADRNAIADLYATYAWANDTRDAALVGTLFVSEPTFVMSIAGETAVGPLDSNRGLVEFFDSALSVQTDQRRHLATNFRYLEETDDTAHVIAYLSLLVTDGGVPSLKCTGVYDTQLVREDLTWRFASMDLALDSGF